MADVIMKNPINTWAFHAPVLSLIPASTLQGSDTKNVIVHTLSIPQPIKK